MMPAAASMTPNTRKHTRRHKNSKTTWTNYCSKSLPNWNTTNDSSRHESTSAHAINDLLVAEPYREWITAQLHSAWNYIEQVRFSLPSSFSCSVFSPHFGMDFRAHWRQKCGQTDSRTIIIVGTERTIISGATIAPHAQPEYITACGRRTTSATSKTSENPMREKTKKIIHKKKVILRPRNIFHEDNSKPVETDELKGI